MSEKIYETIGDKLNKSDGAEKSQMFGKPCLKIGSKAFSCLYDGDMVFKIGKDEVDKLKSKFPGSVNFDPSGKNRPMKDWLQVPADYCKDWENLAKKVMEFVET